MFGIIHHLRKFLLSALKRYSPGSLLQYLLALCRAVFSRCKPEFSGQDSSHEFIHKTLTLAEGKESPSEEGMINSVGRVISACCTPGQMEEGRAHGNEDPAQGGDGPARNVATSLPCVCDRLLPIVYANHYHLLQGKTQTLCALKLTLESKKAYVACGPTVRVCLTW